MGELLPICRTELSSVLVEERRATERQISSSSQSMTAALNEGLEKAFEARSKIEHVADTALASLNDVRVRLDVMEGSVPSAALQARTAMPVNISATPVSIIAT